MSKTGLLVNKINLLLLFNNKRIKNNTFYQNIILKRPYLKTIKKGLTYVWPGDGEPYF